MTTALLGACVVLLVIDIWVTNKWRKLTEECWRGIAANTLANEGNPKFVPYGVPPAS